MGNFLATSMSIALPLLNYTVILPYIFYPPRWGIPWSPPSSLVMGGIGSVVILVELLLLGVLSGVMNTLRQCNKIDLKQSSKRSLWIIMGFLLGNVLLFCMPYIKAPLLVLMIGLPYAGWLVHGIMTAIPVLIFGAIGNEKLLQDVCG